MSDLQSRSAARLRVAEIRPSVEVAVPAGTSLEKVLGNTSLVGALRGLGPRGCETCISGLEFLVKELDEVTHVEFGE
jgi:hypothetical protein